MLKAMFFFSKIQRVKKQEQASPTVIGSMLSDKEKVKFNES